MVVVEVLILVVISNSFDEASSIPIIKDGATLNNARPVQVEAGPNHVVLLAALGERTNKEVFVITHKNVLKGKGCFPQENGIEHLKEELRDDKTVFWEQPRIDRLRIRDVEMVAAGNDYTLLLDQDGGVWCWGEASPAMGIQKLENEYTPYPVYFRSEEGLNSKISYITTGNNFSAAIDTTGHLHLFGNNYFGQCGKDPKISESISIPYSIQQLVKIDNVSCGMYHVLCIGDKFTIYSWGSNSHGQLGYHTPPGEGGKLYSYIPREIPELKEYCCNVIAAGDNNSMASTDSNDIFGWGNNSFFKLGVNSQINAKLSDLEIGQNYPKPTQFDFGLSNNGQQIMESDEYFVAIKLYSEFSTGLTNKKRLLSWGCDCERNLRLVEIRKNSKNLAMEFYVTHLTQYNVKIPDIIDDDNQQVGLSSLRIQSGENYSLLVTENNEVLIWGSNEFFQHGTGVEEMKEFYAPLFQANKIRRKSFSISIQSLPTFVPRFSNGAKREITCVAAGWRHVVVIEKGRTAYAWGSNSHRQLGIGSENDYSMNPTRMKNVSGLELAECSANKDYTLLRTRSGEVFACGSNEHGKLGLPHKDPKLCVDVPEKIPHLNYAIKIATGPDHAMAICSKSSNTKDDIFTQLTIENEGENESIISEQKIIYSWGNGLLGQLGIKRPKTSLSPRPVEINEKVKEISCGWSISGAITEDGKLYLWGNKDNLPVSITQTRTEGEAIFYDIVPMPVLLNKEEIKFKQISLGKHYHCIVDINDKLYSWGSFRKGDPKEQHRAFNIIEEVKGQYSSQKCDYVSVGQEHALYLYSKSVYSWGIDNFTGRLGNMVEVPEAYHSKSRPIIKEKEKDTPYDPTSLVKEPEQIHSVRFILAMKLNRPKKVDNNKSTFMNETVNTNTSGSYSLDILQENSFKFLKDKYMHHLYDNAEKIFSKLDLKVRDYFELVEEMDKQLQIMKYLVYKRITEQPFSVPLRVDNLEQTPSQLRTPEKVNLYNTLLTALQIHPCLLAGLLTFESGGTVGGFQTSGNLRLSPQEFFNLVTSIFGAIHGDSRKENLYLILLEQVFKWETRNAAYTDDIVFFKIGNFNNMKERDLEEEGLKALPYSSLLINYLLETDISYRAILEKIYYYIESKVNEKMKAVEKNLKKFVFAFRIEGNSELEKLYITDNSNWKEEEFQKRRESIQQFFKEAEKPIILELIKANLSKTILKLLHKLKGMFSTTFKDLKGADSAPPLIFWGFLIYPLSKIIQQKILAKRSLNEKETERLKANIESIFDFWMHYSTGTKIRQRRSDSKWIVDLNRFILEKKRFLTEVLNDIYKLSARDGKEDSTYRKEEREQIREDGMLKQYVSQIKVNRPERISVSLALVVKVCKIVDFLKEKIDLFKEFSVQVGEENFLGTNQNYWGNDKKFNFSLMGKFIVMYDFVSVRRCVVCDCYCPSTYIHPSSSRRIIEKCEGIGTNRDLEVYIKYLVSLKFEKAKDELYGRAVGEDKISIENLQLQLDKDNQNMTQEFRWRILDMKRLLERTRDEQEIKIDHLDDLYYTNKEDSAELEPLFLSLREQAASMIAKRTIYNDRLTSVIQDITSIIEDIEMRIIETKALMQKNYTLEGGRKQWGTFESAYMNLQLGFANWTEIDNFEKENKFVRKLRIMIYREPVSQVVYRSLTKLEKSRIKTNFDIHYPMIKNLIRLNKALESHKKKLLMNVGIDEEGGVEFRLIFLNGQNKICLEYQVVEKVSFSISDIFKLRIEVNNNLLTKESTGKDTLSAYTQYPNLSIEVKRGLFVFPNIMFLLETITKAETLNSIYQMIDYLEDSSTPIQNQKGSPQDRADQNIQGNM